MKIPKEELEKAEKICEQFDKKLELLNKLEEIDNA